MCLKTFSLFIQELTCKTTVFTDSKLCVEAFNVQKGGIQFKSQLSPFVMTFNEMNTSLYHTSGKDNNISDFIRRNLIECTNEGCKVCKFLSVESEKTVKSFLNFKIPFTNHVSWINPQK